MNIAIIGLGFVGNAIYETLKLKKIDNIVVYDKFKNGGIGNINECLNSDIMFLCLPTLYNIKLKKYDLVPIEDTLNYLKENNYKGLAVIKSTVTPGTTNELSKKYNLNLCHNPEFLSAKTAYEDFLNQKHIVIGKSINCNKFELLEKFYKKHWPEAKISICSSDESEAVKLGCNCFYSVKIQFFNELFLMCQKGGYDFNIVKDIMLKNDWINPMHTKVPGTDGKLSYGGYCFPKDTNALCSHLDKLELPNLVLKSSIEERNFMRKDNLNFKLNNNNVESSLE
jgi:UDPglucose 6-dehydrogenase